MTTMESIKTLIGCNVKEKNNEYGNLETEYLFKTIQNYGGSLSNSKKIASFTEEPDQLIIEILEKLDVEIRINDDVHDRYPEANALHILEEGIKEDVDVIVMLDTDIVVSQDFSEFLLKEKILAKPEDRDPFTLDAWEQLFDYFKIPFPQERFKTSCTAQETIPYFNGGVIIVPKIYAVELLKNWKYFIERIIDEEEKMPKDFINSSKGVKGNIRFTGQIAFSLALIKSKFPYEALPLSMNYPYSGTVHHTEHPEKLDPFVIHHHHCIAEDGKLLGTPYSNINKRIDEINSFLIENKEYNISLENDNPLVIRNLSMQHDFWEIVERIKNLPLDSTNADLQYYLALSLHHTAGTSSKDEAIARYKMALENDFDKFMIYKDRGYLYYLSSDIDNAKKDLEKALKMNPADVEVIRRISLTDHRIPELSKLHSEKKYQTIIDKLNNLSIDDTNGYLQYYFATALHKTNQRLDEALKRYNTALENGLNDFWLFLNRAALQVSLKNYDDFFSDYEQGYDLLLSYFESTEPHIDYLRTITWKKDEDLEHLRGIIKEIHNSTGWKILTKLDVLKKNDLSD